MAFISIMDFNFRPGLDENLQVTVCFLAVRFSSEPRLPLAPGSSPVFLSNYYIQHAVALASLEVELSRPFPCRTQNINIRALKWKQDLGSHCFTRLLSTDL